MNHPEDALVRAGPPRPLPFLGSTDGAPGDGALPRALSSASASVDRSGLPVHGQRVMYYAPHPLSFGGQHVGVPSGSHMIYDRTPMPTAVTSTTPLHPFMIPE